MNQIILWIFWKGPRKFPLQLAGAASSSESSTFLAPQKEAKKVAASRHRGLNG